MPREFPLSLVLKAVDNASAPLAKIGGKVDGFAKSAASAGRTLSLGLTAPVLALGGVGVAAFGRFEAGLANVSTLVDTNAESMADMGAQVLAISRRTPVALGDLTAALYDVRSAGTSAGDAMRVLEGSARLAVAGLGTTKEAADLVTSSINAFGLQGEEQARVYDLIFKTVQAGKTTIAQLAQGFGGVAGTMASAGIQLDEYLASVAALTTTGLPAAEAHTQLKAAVNGLTGQTKEAAAIFQRLHVKSFKELIATSGGLVPALQRVRGVVKDNDTVLLKAVGGSEAFNASLGLTGKQGASYEATLANMRSGVNALDAAFQKQSATGAATMQRLQNAGEGAAISIGRVLVPVLEGLAPVLEGLANRWEALGGEGQKSIVIMAGAAAALGPTITVIGRLATAIKLANAAFLFVGDWGKYLWMMRASIMASLVPSLAAASASVWGFTAALLANPITWVVGGIALLAGAVYLIYKNWEPIKAFFAKTWESVKAGVGSAIAWIGKHLSWTPLGQLINNWEPVKAFFADLWAGIVATFQRGWEMVRPIVDAVSGAARSVFGGSDGAATNAAAVRPRLDAVSAVPQVLAPRETQARVQVDFANLPPGARVTPLAGNTAPLELDVGYAMGGV